MSKESTRKRHIRKRRPGQPESSYKLDLRVRSKICESILEGVTLADAAALAGVSRQTVNEWRRRGEEKPDSLYGEFSEAFELAKLQSKKGMIQKLLRHKDPLAAVGEAGFGAGQGADCSLCLVVGAGTGAGIIINGTLFRGHSYAAGELGWFLHDETLCGRRFPRLGKLEDLRRGPASATG